MPLISMGYNEVRTTRGHLVGIALMDVNACYAALCIAFDRRYRATAAVKANDACDRLAFDLTWSDDAACMTGADLAQRTT